MRKDFGAANGVATPLYGTPTHQIHPAAKTFFKVLLKCAHLKKPHVALRQKFNEQIYVAARPGRAARHRTKQIYPRDPPFFTNRAYDRPDFI
jgi:hypothetical protein